MPRLLVACLVIAYALFPPSARAEACCAMQGGLTSACSASGFLLCADGSESTCVCSGTTQPPGLRKLQMPATLDFGTLIVGATSLPAEAKIINVGTLPVSITTVLSGAPNEFIVVASTCSTLSGGGSCSVTIVFRPAVASTRSTVINIVSNGVGSPQTFTAGGVGFPASASAPPPPPGAPTIGVVEYAYDAWNHFFVTALTSELAKLDSGEFAGWHRTGLSFRAYPNGLPGTASMCRFFSTAFGERSSHFYTPFANECALVKNNPDWKFEGDVFGVVLPNASGTCPNGLTPLFRLYNDGKGGAPNHRYTTDVGVRSVMAAFGWIPEGSGPIGVIACTP
jgi:hypothetical protein